MQFPAKDNPITIDGPAGAIEAVISRPKNNPYNVVGIICHPHPLQEGTMNNKVVTTVARAYAELGIWAVRFNFRGVGNSAGSYAQGVGETDDLMAVIHWAQQNFPGCAIWLAGFSFGSYIAMCAANQYPIAHLLTIAPPVHHFNFKEPADIQCPWLLIQGDEDEIVPPEQVFAWIETLANPPQLIRLPNVGHFFHGHLIELRNILVANLQVYLPK